MNDQQPEPATDTGTLARLEKAAQKWCEEYHKGDGNRADWEAAEMELFAAAEAHALTPANPTLSLTAEPLELEWRKSGRERWEATIEDDSLRVTASVIHQTTGWEAWAWVFSSHTQAAERPFTGDDPDTLKRQCEEFAGLALALLGLSRPERTETKS